MSRLAEDYKQYILERFYGMTPLSLKETMQLHKELYMVRSISIDERNYLLDLLDQYGAE